MRTHGLRVDAADIGLRFWPLWLFAVSVLIGGVIFAEVEQQIIDRADERAVRTQAALCSLIDRYPTGVDKSIDAARLIGDCGHVKPPTVFLGKPTPGRTVLVISPTPGPARTVVIVAPGSRASPAATHTATPRPTPRPTPTHTPRPSPTPSKTPCLLPGVPPGCG